MNGQLQNDLLHFDNLLETVKLQALDFLQQLPNRPTSTQPTFAAHKTLNEIGLGGLDALKVFNETFEQLRHFTKQH